MPVAYGEVSPLLCGKGCKLLERDEPILAPFIECGSSAHVIRAAARADERKRQEDAMSDVEEFRIFGAVGRQPLEFDEAAVAPFVDNRVDLAVATVHVGGLAGQVFSQLWHGQKQSAVHDEWRDRSRA